MVTEQELTDMRLFEDSGFFNTAQINLIAERAEGQWTPSVDEFAHVCFTANGGAYAFVIVRKSGKNIHSRIFGCPNDKVKTGDLFRKEHTVAVGRWTLIQCEYNSMSVNKLRLPCDFADIVGSTPWADGINGGQPSEDMAEEVFNDCLACFKQAEVEGMIQNLSIIGTGLAYGGGAIEVRAPVIKLMDLELF